MLVRMPIGLQHWRRASSSHDADTQFGGWAPNLIEGAANALFLWFAPRDFTRIGHLSGIEERRLARMSPGELQGEIESEKRRITMIHLLEPYSPVLSPPYIRSIPID